jgi:anti-sigma regulatory factor (Ser/Thr protein kinase)
VDTVRQEGLADVEQQAELLVSELVTNAVVHAHSAVRVELTTGDRRVTVKVFDEGAGWPRVERVSIWSERGRGLRLVELASNRWGVEPSDDGKYVWFELLAGEPPLN